MLEIAAMAVNIVFGLFIFFLIIAFVTGAPFVPSSDQTARTMIELARIKPGFTVYDLGSGDGKLLQLAAEKGATAVGLEINPFLVLLSWVKKMLSRRAKTKIDLASRITVRWNNFWNANLSDANVVFVYLLPWRMEKLEQFLKKQCKSGTLIVSNSFIFPSWPILRQNTKAHVYVFRITESKSLKGSTFRKVDPLEHFAVQ